MKKLIVKNESEVISIDFISDENIGVVKDHNESLGYTVEISDAMLDYDYALSVCREKRKENYPSVGDQLDALYKSRNGDNSDINAIDSLISKVKSDYPKPVKE